MPPLSKTLKKDSEVPRLPRKKFEFFKKVTVESSIDSFLELRGYDLYSDVTFMVGNPPATEIKGHKLVLASASQFFHKLFNPETAPPVSQNNFVFSDIKVNTFKHLLQYIYTGASGNLHIQDLPSLVRAAKRFEIMDLFRSCAFALLKEKLFTIYENICQVESMVEFERDLWEFICRTGQKALESKDFVNISHDTLTRLLQSDDLNCDELVVYQATIRWAEHQCRKEDVDLSGSNLRRFLKDARKMIRFPDFSPLDLLKALGTDGDGILMAPEIHQIYQYKTTKSPAYLMPPLTNRRRNLDDSWYWHLNNRGKAKLTFKNKEVLESSFYSLPQ